MNFPHSSYDILQITIIVSISVSVAMYCLIQLYVPVADRLVHHKPILKLFAIKAVGMYPTTNIEIRSLVADDMLVSLLNVLAGHFPLCFEYIRSSERCEFKFRVIF